MVFQIILPKLTDQMQEGRILEWLCSEGQPVAANEPLFVVETDKAALEVPAEKAGTLLAILAQAGSTVPVGSPVAWVGDLGEVVDRVALGVPAAHTQVQERTFTPPAPAISVPGEAEEVLATPMARRLARELGVDLKAVAQYTGRKRIREEDVQSYARTAPPQPQATGQKAEVAAEFMLLQPTPLERAMASHMALSAAVPQFAAACEVNWAPLELYRTELSTQWEAVHGFHLTYTHLLAALVCRALTSYPRLNASWTPEGIRLYRMVNLGVAMATERGLVVPVVRNANALKLDELATEITRLRQQAERNRLKPDELEGGTFTLTNVGMLGITLSIPVLNPPQSGILAIAAKRDEPAWADGEWQLRPKATITLVADHRVVDGAASAGFLARVKDLIEAPKGAFADEQAVGGSP